MTRLEQLTRELAADQPHAHDPEIRASLVDQYWFASACHLDDGNPELAAKYAELSDLLRENK